MGLTLRRKPSSIKVSDQFESLEDGSLVMQTGEGEVLRLFPKKVHGGGTPFSFYGYLGSSQIDLGNPTPQPFQDCVAVLVLETAPPRWAEYSNTPYRFRCRATLSGAYVGTELALRVDFEQLRRPDKFFHFVLSTSGGLFDPEAHWVNLLMMSMRLLILPNLIEYRPLFLTIVDDGNALRLEMMKAIR